MIEYCIYNEPDRWRVMPADVTFRQNDFGVAMLRIDGVIYKGGSLEFWAAYNKAKTWDLLNANY